MYVILHRAREIIIDDERHLRHVGEGPTEGIVHDEDLLGPARRRTMGRAELGHDVVAG